MAEPDGVVLDASAVLALLNDEPGAEVAARAIPHGVLCAVNHSEVVAKLADAGVPADDLITALSGLGMEVVPFDETLSVAAGLLRTTTAHLGLSLGVRACLALAQARGLPALTADRAWRSLGIDLDVQTIR